MKRVNHVPHALALLLVAALGNLSAAEPTTFQDPNFALIQLPAQFKAQRNTTTFNLAPSQSLDLFNAQGPGCVRHLWLKPDPKTASPVLRIYADDAATPRVAMSMQKFFGVLLGLDPYRLDSAPFEHLTNSLGAGYNCYLPMPFRTSCRITIEATNGPIAGACMVDWQQYAAETNVSPYRLHAAYSEAKPAQAKGTYTLANIAGRGFLAGITRGIRQRDSSDLIYHTGGERWYIDNGTADAHEIDGTNLEDDYGFVWGFQQVMTPWIGVPYYRFGSNYDQDGVVYRFFGTDPVRFGSLPVPFVTVASREALS